MCITITPSNIPHADGSILRAGDGIFFNCSCHPNAKMHTGYYLAAVPRPNNSEDTGDGVVRVDRQLICVIKSKRYVYFIVTSGNAAGTSHRGRR